MHYPDFVYPLLDQLGLACDMVNSDSPSRHRAAIILCDNVVELVAHRIGKEDLQTFLLNEGIRNFKEARADLNLDGFEVKNEKSWRDWDDALGQDFSAKIGFLARWKYVNQREHQFLLEMHRVRNELYHQGLKWFAILQILANVYHAFACELLERLRISHWSSHSRTRKFVEDEALALSLEDFEFTRGGQSVGVVEAFRLRRNVLNQPSQILATYLLESLDEIDGAINYSIEVGFMGSDPLQLLNIGLVEASVPKDVRVRKKLAGLDDLIGEAKDRGFKWLGKDPRPALKRRVEGLANERDEFKGCCGFGELRKVIYPIHKAAVGLARDADFYIQHLVDEARGK